MRKTRAWEEFTLSDRRAARFQLDVREIAGRVAETFL